jgi:hypothetical protein
MLFHPNPHGISSSIPSPSKEFENQVSISSILGDVYAQLPSHHLPHWLDRLTVVNRLAQDHNEVSERRPEFDG